MRSLSQCLIAVTLFLGVCGPFVKSSSAKELPPLSANGQPLTFQIVSASVTRDSQTELTGEILLPNFDPSQHVYKGPFEEVQQPLLLHLLESFVIVNFTVSNARRKLRLSREDVQLIDGWGNPHVTLGAGVRKKGVWSVFDWIEIGPRKDNSCLWIFVVPTAAVSGAIIRFQDKTYPLNLVAPDAVPVVAHVAGPGTSREREIYLAASYGDAARVQALLKDNPDLVFSKDSRGVTPLRLAAAAGNKEVTELLLASKAEVNARTSDGTTPLHMAAANGHKDVVELLLANKADSNAKDTNGETPLQLAVAGNHADVAQALLKDNPDLVFSKDGGGATPLLLAAAKGNKEVAELLLASKAEVNTRASNGRTPLHMAAANGHKDLVELLLANKADPNAKDTSGKTPLELAVAGDHADVVELLRQHGGHE